MRNMTRVLYFWRCSSRGGDSSEHGKIVLPELEASKEVCFVAELSQSMRIRERMTLSSHKDGWLGGGEIIIRRLRLAVCDRNVQVSESIDPCRSNTIFP